MKVDEVAENVPLDGQNERLSAAFQPLEQVGAAESHQPLAGSRKVGNDLTLGCRGRVVRSFADVVAQPVARQVQVVDRIHDGGRVEPSVLVARVIIVDLELDGLGHSRGEVRAGAVGEGQDICGRSSGRSRRSCLG